MLKTYYSLAKPGIVYGNLLTTLAAFLFASRWQFNILSLLATLIGMGLVIASACVFNNYMDRKLDAKMERTKDRAIPSGAVSGRAALTYATALGVLGFGTLIIFVNVLTAAVGLFGFVMYLGPYGLSKRASHWGTVVGSFSGAAPLVAGYTAVADRLDLAALILFLILALWQMPHFYAIAMYRAREYEAAGVPVLPLRKGEQATMRYIIAYIAAFTVAAALLTAAGYAGWTYCVGMLVCGFGWLLLAIRNLHMEDKEKWAKRVFRVSLIVLLAFSALLSVASVLP